MSHQLHIAFVNNDRFVAARAAAEAASLLAQKEPSWENHAAAGQANTDAAVEAASADLDSDHDHHIVVADLHHCACWRIAQAKKRAA